MTSRRWAHPDPAVQADIHASLAQAGPVRVWQVRSALGARGVRQGDALGAFVLEGYRAAGGAVAANLIAEDSVLEDSALVRRVQAARLDDIAEEERARLGLAWAEHRVDPDWEEMAAFGRVHPGPKDLDAETQARVEALEGELEQVADGMDALAGGPQDDATDAAWDALDARCDAIRETLCDLTLEYSAPDAGIGGVIAVWQHGGVRLERGLVRPEDMPQAPADSGTAKDGAGGTGSTGAAEETGLVLAQSFRARLAVIRTRAVGLALARDPDLARLYADWLLVRGVLGVQGGAVRGRPLAAVSVRPGTGAPGTGAPGDRADDMAETPALERMLAFDDTVRAVLPFADGDAAAFAAFRALARAERDSLVARAVAFTLEPVAADRVAGRDPARAAIERAALPDLRAVWTPGAGEFARLTKPQLLGVLADDLGFAREAAKLGSARKSDLVALLTALFDAALRLAQDAAMQRPVPEQEAVARLAAVFAEPPAEISADSRAALAAWCLPGMQTPAAEDEAGGAGGGAGEDPDADGATAAA